jgi:hypothetical protein
MFDAMISRHRSSGAAACVLAKLTLVASLLLDLGYWRCWPCFVSSSSFLPLWLSWVLPSLSVCNCNLLKEIHAQVCS